MTPIEVLKEEHQYILSVLGAAEKEAYRIQNTGKVDVAFVESMVDFFRNYADKYHHAKEEDQLFPRLQERGLPCCGGGGPIVQMLHEHDEGRQYVRNIADGVAKWKTGNAMVAGELAINLLEYVDLLSSHIDKEDNVLYVMAEERLTEDDQTDLDAVYHDVDVRFSASETGRKSSDEYREFARFCAAK